MDWMNVYNIPEHLYSPVIVAFGWFYGLVGVGFLCHAFFAKTFGAKKEKQTAGSRLVSFTCAGFMWMSWYCLTRGI